MPKEKVVKEAPGMAVTAEQIAAAVVEVARGMQVLRGSRLTERAVVVLLKDATGVSQVQIKRVLAGLDDLQRLYVKR